MASRLPEVLLHEQASQHFADFILPVVRFAYEQDGIPDIPARCEAWNNWTDALCQGGQISDWQYENWSHPPCNGD